MKSLAAGAASVLCSLFYTMESFGVDAAAVL